MRRLPRKSRRCRTGGRRPHRRRGRRRRCRSSGRTSTRERIGTGHRPRRPAWRRRSGRSRPRHAGWCHERRADSSMLTFERADLAAGSTVLVDERQEPGEPVGAGRGSTRSVVSMESSLRSRDSILPVVGSWSGSRWAAWPAGPGRSAASACGPRPGSGGARARLRSWRRGGRRSPGPGRARGWVRPATPGPRRPRRRHRSWPAGGRAAAGRCAGRGPRGHRARRRPARWRRAGPSSLCPRRRPADTVGGEQVDGFEVAGSPCSGTWWW